MSIKFIQVDETNFCERFDGPTKKQLQYKTHVCFTYTVKKTHKMNDSPDLSILGDNVDKSQVNEWSMCDRSHICIFKLQM